MLHLPLDFERREDVRRLNRAYPGFGVLYVLRMWMDWATAGVGWRKLKFSMGDPELYSWEEDDLTHIVEQFCQSDQVQVAPPGTLIRAAIAAGVLSIEQKDDEPGLVLRDFWRFNSHLSPTYKSMQQRGAIAKHSKRQMAEMDDLSVRQAEVLERNGQMLFPKSVAASPEEARKCLALVMKLDRACNLPTRHSREYIEKPVMMTTALDLIRRFGSDEHDRVLEYVVLHRDDPRLVKIPERLLECFDDLLGKTKEVKAEA